MKFKLLFLLVLLTPLRAYSQMGIARGIAQVPAPPTTPCSQGAVRFARSTNLVYLCGPNNTWTAVGAAAGTVTGTGTANQFPIFTGTSTIGNSILTQGTNLLEQKATTNPQTFRVYETTANTGSVAQIQALSTANTVRLGSKILNGAATARATEWGYENQAGTFLGWSVSTSGHLNAAGTNLEIGNTNAPKALYLGGTNGQGLLNFNGTTAGTLTIAAPASITSYTLTWPAAVGAANTFVKTDASGNLSYSNTFNQPILRGIATATLTDAATIATDASLGNHFRVTLAGNRTLGNPTNATDGQKIVWEVIQDSTGSRTLSFDTQFAFGSDVASCIVSTTASKRDFIGAIYNSTATKWYVTSCVRGY